MESSTKRPFLEVAGHFNPELFTQRLFNHEVFNRELFDHELFHHDLFNNRLSLGFKLGVESHEFNCSDPTHYSAIEE